MYVYLRMYLFPYTPPLYAPTVHYTVCPILHHFVIRPLCKHTFIFLPIWRLYPLRYVNIPFTHFPTSRFSAFFYYGAYIDFKHYFIQFPVLTIPALVWTEAHLKTCAQPEVLPSAYSGKDNISQSVQQKDSGFVPIFVPVSHHTSTTPCLVIFFHRWEIN